MSYRNLLFIRRLGRHQVLQTLGELNAENEVEDDWMVYYDNSNVLPKVPVKLAKVHADAIVPKYATDLAAGFDLHAYLPLSRSAERLNPGHIAITEDNHPVIVYPGQRRLIDTGLRMQIPAGYELQIRPRSGNASNSGITVLNTPGTIDADYRGEIKVLLINHGEREFVINHGDRIAQGILSQIPQASFEVVGTLDDTERGEGGFGHTGTEAK
jgi:dUTP pyrophosphatase